MKKRHIKKVAVIGSGIMGSRLAAHFANITYGQGASMALPIWAMYMKSCYADENLNISKGEFKKPEELSIETDCSLYVPDQSIDPDFPEEDEEMLQMN